MFKRIDGHEFVGMAVAAGRLGNFGADGWYALFEYLDADEEVEADIVAVCCDYTRFESIAELNEAYSKQYDTLGDVEEDTTIIRIEDSEAFIIYNF